MEYNHTQRAPLPFLILAPAVVLAFIIWRAGGEADGSVAMISVAGVLVVLAFSFGSLTVADENQQLSIRYGPIPLLGTTVAYADMVSVEVGRSSLVDGWGIHYVPKRGWTYNLWGFDCVIVHREDSIVRIGTDDAAQLAAFLEQKIAATSP